MIMSTLLKLNEGLLVVNEKNVSIPIDVYFQDEECYGCPLELLKKIEGETNKYVVDTKHDIRLELRQSNHNTSDRSCRFNHLSLNSQSHTRIDVNQLVSSGDLDCRMTTIDYGECLLCPFAILICFIFIIVTLEQVYTKFWPKKLIKRDSDDHRIDSNEHDDDDAEGNQINSISQLKSDDQTPVATTSKTSLPTSSPISPAIQANSPRIECLDVFRGLTLAGMIFVNYGGAGYSIWEHKAWDGITLADFVFPFFIFSMGASIALSTKSLVKHSRKSFKYIALKIFSRALILLLLGICLNSKAVDQEDASGLTKLRLTGVLQRFSISYLIIASMFTIELTLNKWVRAQSLSNVPYVSRCIGIIFELLTAINYTTIYVYFTFYFEYDSTGVCPTGYVGPGGLTEGGRYASCTGGSAAWLDRLLLGENHLYNDHEVKQIFKTKVTHDPEGLLGYTTSIVLTLIGLQCGKILSGKSTQKQKLLTLSKWILTLALSCSLVVVIPINKRLWSLTFISVSALAAFIIITLFYLMVDIYSCKRAFIIRLFSSAGKNSIFLYVGHSLIYNMLPWWFPVDDKSSHMQLLARLTWATLVWLLIAHQMARKKLFVKV